ncbi:type II toxin-antitoxin system toxin TscT [Staphylococcus xylosus]
MNKKQKFNSKDLICDFELLKEKIEDIASMNNYFIGRVFPFNGNYELSKEETISHGYGYHEHRIHNNQSLELMMMYIKEFENLINTFKELEKASCENFGWEELK